MAHTWVDGEEITAAKLNDIENAINDITSGEIFQTTTNKVTNINSSSTDQTYPSAKAVYDLFNATVNAEIKVY